MASQKEAVGARARLIDDTEAEIRRLLDEAAARIVAILADAPTDYQRWYLPQLQSEIARVLSATATGTASVADTALGAAWGAGAELVDTVIAAPTLTAQLPRIDQRQLAAMRAFTTEKIHGTTLAAVERINEQLALVLIGVQSPFEATQAVVGVLGGAVRKRAAGIVRTELATAYSTAGHLRHQQWAETIPGLQKRWVKSGKLHPRIEHVVIHGQVRGADEPFDLEGGAVKMMHPHDPKAPLGHRINCGCVAVPVVPGIARTIIDAKEQEAKIDAARGRAALQAALNSAGPATLRTMGNAYAVALAGGKHAGLLARLKDEGPKQLRKGVASQQKRLEAHLEKLADPAAIVPDWGQRSPLYQQGLLRKWRGEVEDAREQIEIIKEYRNAKKRTE